MPSWSDNSLCSIEVTPDVADMMFFDPAPHLEALAKDMCERCEVTAECLADAMRIEGALAASARYGIRGGLTGEERALLYTRTQRARRRNSNAR